LTEKKIPKNPLRTSRSSGADEDREMEDRKPDLGETEEDASEL
jgi:hypothetical protein